MTVRGSAGPAGRMQIARGLKALRTRADLTQSEVAKLAGVSVGTVNRYETWQDRAKLRIPTVRAIADTCGATSTELDALTQLVRNQENGWWMDHPAVPEVMDPLMSFEDVAEYEHVFANALVPGLLQTPDTPSLSTRRRTSVPLPMSSRTKWTPASNASRFLSVRPHCTSGRYWTTRSSGDMSAAPT